MASKIKDALPSPLKTSAAQNGDADGFTGRHHGKSQSHVVSTIRISFNASPGASKRRQTPIPRFLDRLRDQRRLSRTATSPEEAGQTTLLRPSRSLQLLLAVRCPQSSCSKQWLQDCRPQCCITVRRSASSLHASKKSWHHRPTGGVFDTEEPAFAATHCNSLAQSQLRAESVARCRSLVLEVLHPLWHSKSPSV